MNHELPAPVTSTDLYLAAIVAELGKIAASVAPPPVAPPSEVLPLVEELPLVDTPPKRRGRPRKQER